MNALNSNALIQLIALNLNSLNRLDLSKINFLNLGLNSIGDEGISAFQNTKFPSLVYLDLSI